MDGPAPEGGSERQVRMAKYYSTNALYEYIQQKELTQFRFAKENIWIMLYGTGESVPKLLLVISAVRGEDYRGRCLTQHEQEIMELAGVLAGRSGLPYRVVRYRLGEERLEEVQYIDYLSGQCAELPIGRLRRLFAQNGLPVIQEGTAKDLNDRASSPFHNWQRAALGRELTASDLDLIRFEPQGGRDVIYELKRSFFPLEQWEPYRRDYPNFRLLRRFADLAGMDLRIVYNQRTKQPFLDDVSRLRLFSFELAQDRAADEGIVTLEDFCLGDLPCLGGAPQGR